MSGETDLERLRSAAAWTSNGPDGQCGMRMELRGGHPCLVVLGNHLQPVPEHHIDDCAAYFQELRPAQLIVDLSDCQHMASMVLAFLVHLHRSATQSGVKRSIIHRPNPRVLALLKLIGITQFYPITADDAALTALLAKPLA